MNLVCDWLILCERALVDQHSGSLSLIHCIEQISAMDLPTLHPNVTFVAHYSCVGDAPDEQIQLEYRLVRFSAVDAEGEVHRFKGVWQPGVRRGRVLTRFSVIRLRRPETVWFRLDHREVGKKWKKGATVWVDVVALEVTPAQRAKFRADMKALHAAEGMMGELPPPSDHTDET